MPEKGRTFFLPFYIPTRALKSNAQIKKEIKMNLPANALKNGNI